MGSLGAALDLIPRVERDRADVALPDIRRSRRPTRRADHCPSISARARSTHIGHHWILPNRRCRQIQQERPPVPSPPGSFQPLQRGYLGASLPPSRFMFFNKNRCFSEEAALTGKYRPSSAIASSTVEIPTTCIKLRISSRSVSPRSGSMTLAAFSFNASKYSAVGTETTSPGGLPPRGNVANSK